MNDRPAQTLPAGFTRSAWGALDPSSRILFLQEILANNPKFRVSGVVDYERSAEPLLIDRRDGELLSLSGESVSGGPIEVTVFPGGFLNNRELLLAVLAGLAGLAFIL